MLPSTTRCSNRTLTFQSKCVTRASAVFAKLDGSSLCVVLVIKFDVGRSVGDTLRCSITAESATTIADTASAPTERVVAGSPLSCDGLSQKQLAAHFVADPLRFICDRRPRAKSMSLESGRDGEECHG